MISFFGCPRMSMYVRRKLEANATLLSGEMRVRNVSSWISAAMEFVHLNREVEAVRSFKSVLMHGKKPNHAKFIGLIRAVGLMGSEVFAQEVHGLATKMGFDMEASVVTSLMGMYSIHGMSSVSQLFDQTAVKDVILWSAMVTALAKNGRFHQAIEYFRRMWSSGVMPNHVTIISVLPACTGLGALLTGKEIHALAVKNDFCLDCNLQNALMVLYARCKDPTSSITVFEQMQEKNVDSWNIIIRGCLENQSPKRCLSVFKDMISLYVRPDETTFRTLLSACSEVEELNCGLMLHCCIVKNGFLTSLSIATALLTMYAGFGEVDTSRILFDSLDRKDLIAWSAMISAYAQAGSPHCAIGLFREMQQANDMPNAITFVSLLKASSMMGAQDHGDSIHAHIIRKGYSSNVFISSALIDFYCSFGRLGEGRKVFDEIVEKDLVCWGSLINGYGVNGCGKDALETFLNMLEQGFRPNGVVFVSVLAACSHCGLVAEGWKWFNCMNEKFGVMPNLVHYTCMVDLLSRQGLVEEALDFINQMPVKPDASVWGALLAGCRAVNGDIKIMELAAEELTRLDPSNTSYYVILSNLYAEQGEWNDVERLRGWVRQRKMQKLVGCSMVGSN